MPVTRLIPPSPHHAAALLTACALWGIGAAPAAQSAPMRSGRIDSVAPGDIVVNEIMKDPAQVPDADGEYIELANTAGVPIDINGWTLSDAGSDSHTIDAGGPLLVPAGGYLVLARDTSSANGGVPAAYQYSGFTLTNSDDEVILRDAGGALIDSVAYDDGIAFPDPSGASLELVNPELDNALGVNWAVALAPYGLGDMGTPGAVNSVWEPAGLAAIDLDPGAVTVPQGGSVPLTGRLVNRTASPLAPEAATWAILPGGRPYPGNPLNGPVTVPLGPGEVVERALTLPIPSGTPPGEYLLIGLVGLGPRTIWDRDTVRITVEQSPLSGAGEERGGMSCPPIWPPVRGWWGDGHDAAELVWRARPGAGEGSRADVGEPADAILHAFPNPFAAAVTLRVVRRAGRDGAEMQGSGAVGSFVLYAVRGGRVRSLRPLEGSGGFVWDGRDDAGRDCPGGVYWAVWSGEGGTGRMVRKIVRRD